ncbi:hypothetical protein, partial [Listeria monocytogenes]|uniref:hypothetical protein n=1 Tax=Listeria monocytogenes TaxID=1639 RepID=UPI00350E48E1
MARIGSGKKKHRNKAPKCALLFGLVTTVYVRTGAIMAPDTGTHPYIAVLLHMCGFVCLIFIILYTPPLCAPPPLPRLSFGQNGFWDIAFRHFELIGDQNNQSNFFESKSVIGWFCGAN